ncbi:D-aminoacylase [Candidatus Palauibacter soopunensis]|uniref:N-acyl-D-amino-acid deacylase family protein n=1 Tax=Candidatus Palauibacter soopunensis TaxID=3056739 RepID=UPI002383FF29|nr:D-aminoacylase [Candidatus Palauibacter soopunensis]MDE2877749.1 D-aminoacylase [Candidatus Palauibacter soopunensis]
MRRTLPRPAPGLVAALVLTACGVVPESADDGATTRAGDAPYDLVIVGGTVVDGTGADRFTADVGIRGGRVVEVARDGGLSGRGAEEIDASGLIVSPGFVDHHNHVQNQVHRRPLAENFIRQGITTILPSLHSGDQPYPLRDYIEDLEVAPNIGFFAGHTWTREQVLGMEDRAPTPEELDEMRDLVREAMEDGALGLATGLLYVPANYAETEEVIELAKVAAEYGGIYYTHMRDEARGLLPAVREAIRIGAEGGLPVHINHFKAMGVDNWGKTVESLALVDSARAEGIDVKVDLYPYLAGSTGSSVLFPQWVLAGGVDSFRVRVTDPEIRPRVERETEEWMRRDWTGGDLSRIQFRTLRAFPEYNGRRMSDLAADRGLPNNDATGVQLAIELQLAGGFSAIYHFMDEADVIRIMRHPQAMFETDGDPVGYGLGFPHPRSYGTFPRILGRYVREMGVLTLEEAIRKMTSMSTDEIGQSERGRIAPGMWADITVFDADRIIDRADYVDPHRYSVGIHHVIVNGVPVILDGSVTGAKPGHVLKGPARHLTETRG